MGVSKKFFCLPESMKKPFSRGSFACNVNLGFVRNGKACQTLLASEALLLKIHE